MWHFHLGGPLVLTEIHPGGKVRRAVLGRDIGAGQEVQHLVPAGCWFGAQPRPGSGFSLVGCTVSPGFEFADFDAGDRERLLRRFPRSRSVIEQLTRASAALLLPVAMALSGCRRLVIVDSQEKDPISGRSKRQTSVRPALEFGSGSRRAFSG